MTPYLPQHDRNLDARKAYLERNRKDYNFNRDLLPPLPFLEHVPMRELFSADYVAKRLASMANLPANILVAKIKNFLDPLDTLKEYDELLTLLPKPNVMKHYRTDAAFAEQRLSGCNAMATHQLQTLPENFGVDNALFQGVLGGDVSLEQALKDGQLYFLEHPFLDGIQGGTSKAGRKYMPKTRSLFYWAGGEKNLVPVAIEVKSESGNTIHMYTPKDTPLDWFFAKLCVQVADCNHQELGSHFSFTHAAMGPLAVVTARQLGEHHPISLLLKPHMRFMIFDNDLGRTSFLNPGGPIDDYAAGTLCNLSSG
ncbi:MAG: hypothetical protein HC851_18970 [Acaryochloris sp. RU_4_1]|nr:hypothetical protein [Acaryochloris sp. RU_4_1]NJR54736.1 hypothetical protein [Acaryochloris sp. CRU_2_0]